MLGVIGNRFSIGKETYHPFSVELHYFRIEKRYWSICFERIKRAGFRIIATAVPWNIHQLPDKSMDFAGMTDPRKDLIVFLELAREFGFKIILRPGPWVGGQLKNGGLPDHLFTDLKLFARDADGQELELPEEHGVKSGYLPSYLHPHFQFHLKQYFKSFIEITKNYVHPRGPIFMVELDYETSFGKSLDPGSADYNPEVLQAFYPGFLQGIYGDIKKLNTRYREKNKGFEEVEPPRKFKGLDMKHLPKVVDWMKFREHLLRVYLETLEEVFGSYTVEPLIFRSLYFKPGQLLPAFNLVPDDRSPFLGCNIFPQGSYFDLATKARFLRSEYGFGFAASFASGLAVENTDQQEQVSFTSDNTRRFHLSAGLATGLKGMNHYMFVDREHWIGAPLRNDGTVAKGYEIMKRFNLALSEVGLDEMKTSDEIAVVGNRLYYWLSVLRDGKCLNYVSRLLDDSTVGFCRDLTRLKLNYGVRENRDWSSLKNYKLLFIPSAEVMARSDQEAIVELLKEGVKVVLCGLMPKYDENFKDCQILANQVRIKTTVDYRIGNVEHKGGNFPTYVYASIRTTDDSKIRRIVKSGTKVVGVSSSRLAGTLYLFSFDIASGGNHQKLAFVESILTSEGFNSTFYCSDPSVDIAFQMGPKKGLLFVVAPPPGELSDGIEASSKEIIIQADLKPFGMKAPKLKLIDLFADEEDPPIKTTAKELKAGMPLTMSFPGGAIFLVQKR